METLMFKRRNLLATAALVLAASAVQAQSDRPIRLMVGFPAGGSIDTVARVLADKMKDDLRQPVLVENKPGAGGDSPPNCSRTLPQTAAPT